MELKEYIDTELNFTINTHIDGKQNVWFEGKELPSALGYKDTNMWNHKTRKPSLVNRKGRSIGVLF